MIHVQIERTADGSIRSFQIAGHADFAKHGQDIVCAGVSAVSFGMVNAVEELLGIELDCELGEDGFLHATIPESVPEEKRDQLRLLLESMLVMLRTIEQSYGDYIKIQDNLK